MADKIQYRICSSIVEKDGKYGVLIHDDFGKVLVDPDCRFDTVDEAKAAGTAILSKGMELMKKEGYTAYRPESEALLPMGAVSFIYVPSQADVEPDSQGLFITERTGLMPADLRVYTLAGFFEKPPCVWKESPESVEWLFEVTRNNAMANLNDPAVFATLSDDNVTLISLLKLRSKASNHI